MIDQKKLLVHMKKKSEHRNILIHAVLAGLITAIERGDFDTDNDKEVTR